MTELYGFVGYNRNCIVLMETVMDPVGLHC